MTGLHSTYNLVLEINSVIANKKLFLKKEMGREKKEIFISNKIKLALEQKSC